MHPLPTLSKQAQKRPEADYYPGALVEAEVVEAVPRWEIGRASAVARRDTRENLAETPSPNAHTAPPTIYPRSAPGAPVPDVVSWLTS